jgi:hypothetical protein
MYRCAFLLLCVCRLQLAFETQSDYRGCSRAGERGWGLCPGTSFKQNVVKYNIQKWQRQPHLVYAFALGQCFSNYGPRTASGPRGVSLWSFTKDRRKKKNQIHFVSYYSWKYQSLEITHGNSLSRFLPGLTFYEIYYPTRLPTTHPTLSNKRGI